MKFKINPIKPAMTHEEKVYEYARRIAHYSKEASSQRDSSKVFKCKNLLRNQSITGKACGCYSNDITYSESRATIGMGSLEPCEPCIKAHVHYLAFREAKAKQGAAMRQLASEMKRNGKDK